MPLQKDQVKDAPRVDPDDGLSPDEERRLWEHYGRSDYDEWQGEDRTRALGQPEEDEDRASGGDGGRRGRRRAAVVGVRLRRIVVVSPTSGPDERREQR